jgi:hypothetical protein
MAMNDRNTVIGVFDDHLQADRAVADLRMAGFRDDQIGVATPHSGDATNEKAAHALAGASAGAALGAGAGGLIGLGVLSGIIPGIGPAILAGTLGILLANAAGGAAIAGLAGALVGLGLSDDEAKHYEGEFKAGRTLVTVKDLAGRYNDAWEILYRHGAYNRETAKAMDAARGKGHAAVSR